MGTIPSVTVGEVASFQANKAFSAFNVADNAYAITSGLKTLSAASKLGTITLTGPSPLEVTGNDFTAYAAVLHKLAKGTALSVAAATVAQAAKAQADASVTSISVADSAAKIAAGLAALATETKLASLWVIGGGTLSVTAANFTKYQATLDKLVNGQAFTVTGATVAQAAALQADSHCGGFTITDSGANILAAIATLAKDTKLTGMSLTTAGALALTWEQFTTYQSTLDKFTNASFSFASLTAGQSMGVLGDSHLGSVNVVDTLVNVQNQLSGLALNSHLASLKLSDASSITLTGGNDFQQYESVLDKLVTGQGFIASGITAAQAAKAQADAHCASFSVADTAANVLANATALNGDSHLTSVRLTDGPLTLTQAQFTTDATLVSKLAEGSAVKVTGVTAANAATVAGNAHVWQVGVSDTLANIGAKLDALEALAKGGHLSGITVTDSGKTLTLTSAQYDADADAIKLMSGKFTINHPAGSGFHINLVYDSSMSQAPAAFKAALDVAVKYFEATIASTETVSLSVGYGECGGQAIGNGVLGEAGPTRGVYVSYDQFKTAFASHATSATQQTVLANMGADPTKGGTIFVAAAEAKALGLMNASDTSVIDGAMGFAKDATGSLFDYDTTNRAQAGHYDFLGVVEHEMTHALGRFAILDNTHHQFSALDLTRYSAAGVHQLNGSGYGYFSIDGGKTNLDVYSTSSDTGDWASSAGNDANSAFANPGVANLFTQTDLVQINALGYALV